MDFFVSTELTPQNQWQLELMIESFKTIGLEDKLPELKAFTRSHAHMHLLVTLVCFNADRTPEGGEPATVWGGMAQNQGMGPAPLKFEGEIETNSVGADVVDGGVNRS